MKKIFLASVALAAFGAATSASAADLAARPYTKAPPMMVAMYDWSGFYLGANGGWGTARKCFDNTSQFGVPTVPVLAEGCHNATGGTVGGQVGYRWQSAAWVFGLEAQGNWADFKGSNVSVPSLGTVLNRTKVEALGLFTAQIGYAWNNTLLYVKGGAAVASDKYQGVTIATGVPFDAAKETRWGGAVGVGLEYGFTPNWSVAVEYDHLFLGNRAVDFVAVPVAAVSRTDRIRQDVDMVTARVNYKFGGPVIAKY